MKKTLYRLLFICITLCLLVALISSCSLFGDNNNQKKTHTVVFVNNNGRSNTTVEVSNGSTLNQPSDPEKENYLFEGWYIDEQLTRRFSFSQKVEKDFALYAKYTIDAVSVSNKVSMEVMRGIVKVYNKCYTTSSSGTSWQTRYGSGFCFYRGDDGVYYILTNCHVAQKSSQYKSQEFSVEDYQGHTYTAYLYSNSNKMGNAISGEYDLACLYFTITDSSSIKPLTLAKTNPQLNEDIVSIGAPEKQSNFFTFGKIQSYTSANVSTNPTINVSFGVLKHNAYANHGSSGGPILNADLEVVGVNFVARDKDVYSEANDFTLSIPIEKVQEFLKLYVYK